MLTLKNIALPDFSYTDPTWIQFYEIFRDSIHPGLCMRTFKSFYHFQKPILIDLSFIVEEEQVIGFICSSFYSFQVPDTGKKYTVARGTAGILPAFRGGKMPSFRLCMKYIKYKLMHPFERIIITGYMANPKLYSMMCRYANRVYPKTGITEPAYIKPLRDAVLGTKHRSGEYLVGLHFKVNITERDRNSINSSNDPHITFFLSLNPDYGNETGLFTMIPLDWGNILYSIKKEFMKKRMPRVKVRYKPNIFGFTK